MRVDPRRAGTIVRRATAKGQYMTDQPSPTIEEIFRKLDQWRHLPAYRLEPQLSPYFGLFLPEILRCKLNAKIEENCVVIPEFPLPLKCLQETRRKFGKTGAKTNLSVKVDYAVFSIKHDESYFVELKTDEASYREEQFCYLMEAREQGFSNLVEGLIEIIEKTKQQRKYAHLLLLLADIPLIKNYNRSLLEKAVSQDRLESGLKWHDILEFETITDGGCRRPEIVYITPDGKRPNEKDLQKACINKDAVTNISFGEVAGIVKNRGRFGCMFAEHLVRWEEPAGVLKSQNICTGK